MGKDEKKLFIVLEEHLEERYRYMINKFNFESYSVEGFGDIQIGTSLKNIVNRIKHRAIIKDEFIKLKNFIDEKFTKYQVNQIYFSNSEGYIAYNFLTQLKVYYPNLEFVGLQHGVFELSEIPQKNTRLIINKFFKYAFDFYPIGTGFGSKIVDKYIVYNDAYKNFLIKHRNWQKDKVEVDLEFLKCELFDKKISRAQSNTTTGLFLMQCLSKANMCSEKEEKYLNKEVIRYLKKLHDTVLIKNHPACINNFELNQESQVREVDNLIDAFNQSTHAYSFSSTTLLEAKIFDIEAYAINSKLVKENKSIFNIFDNVINFENEIIS